MTNVKLNVLQPSLLVSLKSSVRGGVSYVREDLDSEKSEDAAIKRWKTEKRVENAAEFDAATTARSKARSLISAVCSGSSFGLICPLSKEKELDAAIKEARAVAVAHNAQATHTQVEVFVIVGKIAQTDEEAARAISSEVKDLLDEMKAATLEGNVERIRAAANKARELGSILSPDAEKQVSSAIDEARKNAKELVKRVQKDGEKLEVVLKDLYVQRIDNARGAFLDLEEGEVKSVEHVGRAVEVA